MFPANISTIDLMYVRSELEAASTHDSANLFRATSVADFAKRLRSDPFGQTRFNMINVDSTAIHSARRERHLRLREILFRASCLASRPDTDVGEQERRMGRRYFHC